MAWLQNTTPASPVRRPASPPKAPAPKTPPKAVSKAVSEAVSEGSDDDTWGSWKPFSAFPPVQGSTAYAEAQRSIRAEEYFRTLLWRDLVEQGSNLPEPRLLHVWQRPGQFPKKGGAKGSKGRGSAKGSKGEDSAKGSKGTGSAKGPQERKRAAEGESPPGARSGSSRRGYAWAYGYLSNPAVLGDGKTYGFDCRSKSACERGSSRCSGVWCQYRGIASCDAQRKRMLGSDELLASESIRSGEYRRSDQAARISLQGHEEVGTGGCRRRTSRARCFSNCGNDFFRRGCPISRRTSGEFACQGFGPDYFNWRSRIQLRRGCGTRGRKLAFSRRGCSGGSCGRPRAADGFGGRTGDAESGAEEGSSTLYGSQNESEGSQSTPTYTNNSACARSAYVSVGPGSSGDASAIMVQRGSRGSASNRGSASSCGSSRGSARTVVPEAAVVQPAAEVPQQAKVCAKKVEAAGARAPAKPSARAKTPRPTKKSGMAAPVDPAPIVPKRRLPSPKVKDAAPVPPAIRPAAPMVPGVRAKMSGPPMSGPPGPPPPPPPMVVMPSGVMFQQPGVMVQQPPPPSGVLYQPSPGFVFQPPPGVQQPLGGMVFQQSGVQPPLGGVVYQQPPGVQQQPHGGTWVPPPGTILQPTPPPSQIFYRPPQ